MEKSEDEFLHEHLIVAYDSADNFAGMFITYSEDEISKSELLNSFYGIKPHYLIVADIPDIEGLTPENYVNLLESLIDDLRENNTSKLNIEYYIPKTLH